MRRCFDLLQLSELAQYYRIGFGLRNSCADCSYPKSTVWPSFLHLLFHFVQTSDCCFLRAAGPISDSVRCSLSCSYLLNCSPATVWSSFVMGSTWRLLRAFYFPARTLQYWSSCWTFRPYSGQPWRLRAKAISVSPYCWLLLNASCHK